MRAADERSMLTWDGTKLFYRAWLPGRPERALIVLHRGHEHSGRLTTLIEALELGDTAVFAWDARGHGLSGGERSRAGAFMDYVRDLDAFARWIVEEHGIPLESTAVLGHSLGAVVAAAWVHGYAPPIRALALAAPAFRVRLYVPFAIPALRLLRRLRPEAAVRSYVRPAMLTHDPVEIDRYRRDPLIARDIGVGVLLDLHDASTRLIADACAIVVPTMVLTSGADLVVHRSAQEQFFEALGASTKALATYPGLYHSLFHERSADRPIAAVRSFLVEALRPSAAPPSRMDPGVQPSHVREHGRLARPLPPWSPARLAWGAVKLTLQTVGRLSAGIRLGWRQGFDSGASLDYVYENTARGVTRVGRWIDRLYLDRPGWRGIRERRGHLEQALRQAIELAGKDSRPVRILDVAAGCGRYVMDVLRTRPADGISAELRDADAGVVATGSRIARGLGLGNVRFAVADAFDPASLAATSPRPNIAIVSGLYELFGDNRMVLTSLRGLREAMDEGGCLIYTNQPYHPHLALIARVLTNREGRPWVMRCRSQAEMDGLVRSAGFEKIGMAIGNDGMFTVSLARAAAGSAR